MATVIENSLKLCHRVYKTTPAYHIKLTAWWRDSTGLSPTFYSCTLTVITPTGTQCCHLSHSPLTQPLLMSLGFHHSVYFMIVIHPQYWTICFHYTSPVAQRFQKVYQLARLRTQKVQQGQRLRYDVWLWTPTHQIDLSTKVMPRYTGPYRVI